MTQGGDLRDQGVSASMLLMAGICVNQFAVEFYQQELLAKLLIGGYFKSNNARFEFTRTAPSEIILIIVTL